MAVGFIKISMRKGKRKRENTIEITVFCRLILEVMYHNFCHHAFIERSPGYIQMEGTTQGYEYQRVGDFWEPFQKLPFHKV